jgi:UDP-2-acetamido-2,6-beta-L-arabino-hexul-4-ose reductase
MRVLITGAKGFIGKNLIEGLKIQKCIELDEFDRDCDISLLEEYCSKADFVYHLAGINRPENENEYKEGNIDLTYFIINALKKYHNTCPILYSSSMQALLDNPYGRSKKAGEELLLDYAQETGTKVFLYRFPNVFGKWCRPNYNSVVATFCYNIAHNQPIHINNPEAVVNLIYIDDLVTEIINCLWNEDTLLVSPKSNNFYEVNPVYTVTLSEIAKLLYSFQSSRKTLDIPDISDDFTKKLYSTYLSYLPEQDFAYDLNMHTDHRGSFTEILKQLQFGQISVNAIKPGVVKGNHWHNTKVEKFLVVSGKGIIRLRDIHSCQSIDYYVCEDRLTVVDIPPGYTHNIENLGSTDLVTIIWANESFDTNKPDTYYLEV